MKKWFIRAAGILYWCEERGEWGPKERATAYDRPNQVPTPLAFAPFWSEETISRARLKKAA